MNKKWLIKVGMGFRLCLIPSVLWANTLGVVNVEVLNVRKEPFTASQILSKARNGEQLEIIEQKEGWYKIKLPSGQMAYVKDDYVQILEVQGSVTVNQLNLRSYPSLSESRIITKLPLGAKVKILYRVNTFYKIAYEGHTGFVYASYIELPPQTDVPERMIEQVNEVPVEQIIEKQEIEKDEESTEQGQLNGEDVEDLKGALGGEIVSYASRFLGGPYVYGGNDLLTGVDCSGFTQQILKAFNISIPRTAYLQSTIGTQVIQEDIKQGDLIFFGSGLTHITHVGIYIGEGQMIHSSTPQTGIIISPAFNNGSTPMQAIRRMY